ncbi:uncharacterized protein [Aegilops tauschii subsp. strangulata]|uniref:uncharacterized protein isoform X4 n=1 Tax=Aegilops tauschii subsp. strangulata TaxID=200361 RepID=UPI001E1CA8B2|nr:uncharacterized protein LOC120974127 isoform X4 [Aegilops tauschii subsp. strangulata]
MENEVGEARSALVFWCRSPEPGERRGRHVELMGIGQPPLSPPATTERRSTSMHFIQGRCKPFTRKQKQILVGEEYLPGVVCAAMTRRGRSDDLSGQRGEDARAAATRLGRRRLGLLLATGMSNWTTGRSLVEGPAGGGRRRRGLLLATGTSSWTTGRSLAEAPAGGGRRRRRRMGLLLVWTSSWRRGGACCWPGCAALEEDNEVLSFVFTWSEISPSDNYFGTEGVVGCHLFMQVFILDSLELGVLNKPQGVTPRIGLYDYE